MKTILDRGQQDGMIGGKEIMKELEFIQEASKAQSTLISTMREQKETGFEVCPCPAGGISDRKVE